MPIDPDPQCECYKAGRSTGKCGKTNAGSCSCAPYPDIKMGAVPRACRSLHGAIDSKRVAALKRMGYREGSVWFKQALNRE